MCKHKQCPLRPLKEVRHQPLGIQSELLRRCEEGFYGSLQNSNPNLLPFISRGIRAYVELKTEAERLNNKREHGTHAFLFFENIRNFFIITHNQRILHQPFLQNFLIQVVHRIISENMLIKGEVRHLILIPLPRLLATSTIRTTRRIRIRG